MIDWIFASGSGLLSTSIGLNAVSAHGTCTAVFVAVAAIASFALGSVRTLGKMKWIAWVGLACVFVAGRYALLCPVIMLTRISYYGNHRSWSPKQAIHSPQRCAMDIRLQTSWQSLVQQRNISRLLYRVCIFWNTWYGSSYPIAPRNNTISNESTIANVGFFPIAAEMRDPSMYTRPLLICQGSITAIYISIGTVIYYYCGSYVASPALGSAGVLIKKVSYGIALPGLVVSTIVVLHVRRQVLIIRCTA